MKTQKYTRLITALLIFCLLLACIPVQSVNAVELDDGTNEMVDIIQEQDTVTLEPLDQGSITQLVAPEAFCATDYVQRVKEDETLSTYVFEKSNGDKTVYYFEENVKFEKNGQFFDKDLTLVVGTAGYTVAQNDVELLLPHNPAKGILVHFDQATVRLVPQGLQNTSAHEANGAVVYQNAFDSGVDLKYTPLMSGLKEDIILDQYIPNASYSFILETGGLSLFEDREGWFLAESADGNAVFRLSNTLVYDAVGRPCEGGLTVETIKAGSKYLLTVSAPNDFLSDPITVYPVTIDPSITVDISQDPYAIMDAPIFSGYPSNNYGSFIYNRVGTVPGYGVGRTVVKLPGLTNSSEYSSLADYTQIKNVKFYVTEASGTTNQLVHLYPLVYNTSWTEYSITWNNVGQHSTAIDSTATLFCNTTTYFDITALVQAWKKGTYSANAGFIMISDNESINKGFYATDASSKRPYVVMTYGPRVTLNKSSVLMDIGETLKLTATTNPTGLSLTWSSSNSAVATVDSSGNVRAVAGGNATISVSCTWGGQTSTAKCNIEVPFISNGIYRIKNTASNMYLTVPGASTTTLTNVCQANAMNNNSGQLWRVTKLGDNQYEIRPSYSDSLYLSLNTYTGNVVIREETPVWIATRSGSSFVISTSYDSQDGGVTTVKIRPSDGSTTANVDIIFEAYTASGSGFLWTFERVSD